MIPPHAHRGTPLAVLFAFMAVHRRSLRADARLKVQGSIAPSGAKLVPPPVGPCAGRWPSHAPIVERSRRWLGLGREPPVARSSCRSTPAPARRALPRIGIHHSHRSHPHPQMHRGAQSKGDGSHRKAPSSRGLELVVRAACSTHHAIAVSPYQEPIRATESSVSVADRSSVSCSTTRALNFARSLRAFRYGWSGSRPMGAA